MASTQSNIEYKVNNVLLVDDNSFSNLLTKSILKEINIAREISIANDGLEALKILMECDRYCLPDLILLDLVMPKMDGIDFLHAIQDMKLLSGDKPRVIVLSAAISDSNIRKLYELGVSDILSKPLEKEKLLNIVEKYFLNPHNSI